MGSSSTEVKEVEATVEAAAQTVEAATTAEAATLHEKIAQLEAKVKALEEGAVAAVKEDVRQIANFLKTKYPYSL